MIRTILTIIFAALLSPAWAQSLTSAQIATLRAACNADQSCAALASVGNDAGVAEYLNGQASPTWFVWRSTTEGDAVLDAIAWAALTPVDAPDGTAAYTNRALAIQARQINLQIMLQGRASIATGRASIRQGLSDALLNVPSGAGGALLDAGWLGAGRVKAAITRTATRAEKILSTGTGTSGTPAVLGWEGLVTQADASLLR